MRLLAVCLLTIVTVISCSPRKDDSPASKRMDAIESNLTQFTIPLAMFMPDSGFTERYTLAERMTYYKVPGVSIAVIAGDSIDWAKGYGFIKAESDTPVTTRTIFQAASTSKLLTAVIVLHYEEQGTLDLDADVNNYLTSWKMPENEFTREKKVTLRLLLTHQAGLPATNFNHEENMPYPTLIDVLNGKPPAINRPAVPEFVPGSKWQYSNMGYVVIQQLLEDVTGKPFTVIADEVIFKPLRMTSSTFSYPLMPGDSGREALPHDSKGITRSPRMHLTAVAHGGLMSTPLDLARFTIELMRAYKGESGRIISPNVARQLFQTELHLDPRLLGLPLSEGLGVMLYGRRPNFVFAHPGSNVPGANCWLLGAPESGDGAVIMTNGYMGEILAMEIITAIIKEYRWPIDQPPTI